MQRPRLRDLLPVTVTPFDAEEVTSRSHRETDPRGVGLTSKDVDTIWQAVVHYYKLGLHPSLALCIRRRGEVILDRAHRAFVAMGDRKFFAMVLTVSNQNYALGGRIAYYWSPDWGDTWLGHPDNPIIVAGEHPDGVRRLRE